MPRRRHRTEEIVAKLRQVEVLTAPETATTEASRQIEVTGVTYDLWRKVGDSGLRKAAYRGG